MNQSLRPGKKSNVKCQSQTEKQIKRVLKKGSLHENFSNNLGSLRINNNDSLIQAMLKVI